jgi:hypothetical protein
MSFSLFGVDQNLLSQVIEEEWVYLQRKDVPTADKEKRLQSYSVSAHNSFIGQSEQAAENSLLQSRLLGLALTNPELRKFANQQLNGIGKIDSGGDAQTSKLYQSYAPLQRAVTKMGALKAYPLTEVGCEKDDNDLLNFIDDFKKSSEKIPPELQGDLAQALASKAVGLASELQARNQVYRSDRQVRANSINPTSPEYLEIDRLYALQNNLEDQLDALLKGKNSEEVRKQSEYQGLLKKYLETKHQHRDNKSAASRNGIRRTKLDQLRYDNDNLYSAYKRELDPVKKGQLNQLSLKKAKEFGELRRQYHDLSGSNTKTKNYQCPAIDQALNELTSLGAGLPPHEREHFRQLLKLGREGVGGVGGLALWSAGQDLTSEDYGTNKGFINLGKDCKDRNYQIVPATGVCQQPLFPAMAGEKLANSSGDILYKNYLRTLKTRILTEKLTALAEYKALGVEVKIPSQCGSLIDGAGLMRKNELDHAYGSQPAALELLEAESFLNGQKKGKLEESAQKLLAPMQEGAEKLRENRQLATGIINLLDETSKQLQAYYKMFRRNLVDSAMQRDIEFHRDRRLGYTRKLDQLNKEYQSLLARYGPVLNLKTKKNSVCHEQTGLVTDTLQMFRIQDRDYQNCRPLFQNLDDSVNSSKEQHDLLKDSIKKAASLAEAGVADICKQGVALDDPENTCKLASHQQVRTRLLYENPAYNMADCNLLRCDKSLKRSFKEKMEEYWGSEFVNSTAAQVMVLSAGGMAMVTTAMLFPPSALMVGGAVMFTHDVTENMKKRDQFNRAQSRYLGSLSGQFGSPEEMNKSFDEWDSDNKAMFWNAVFASADGIAILGKTFKGLKKLGQAARPAEGIVVTKAVKPGQQVFVAGSKSSTRKVAAKNIERVGIDKVKITSTEVVSDYKVAGAMSGKIKTSNGGSFTADELKLAARSPQKRIKDSNGKVWFIDDIHQNPNPTSADDAFEIVLRETAEDGSILAKKFKTYPETAKTEVKLSKASLTLKNNKTHDIKIITPKEKTSQELLDEIQKQLAELPVSEAAKLDEVIVTQYSSGGEVLQSGGNGSAIQGIRASSDGKSITFYSADGKIPKIGSGDFSHEFGHVMAAKKFDDYEPSGWRTHFIDDGKKAASSYADADIRMRQAADPQNAPSLHEDFAETVRHYLQTDGGRGHSGNMLRRRMHNRFSMLDDIFGAKPPKKYKILYRNGGKKASVMVVTAAGVVYLSQ